MKTKSDKWQVTSGKRLAVVRESSSCHRSSASASTLQRGFTLIELLVVISIMALIAAFILPVTGAIKRQQYLSTAKSEIDQIASALNSYQSQFGTYPPANPRNPAINPLYYELTGCTNRNDIQRTWAFDTLDSASWVSVNNYSAAFNVGGVINCNKAGTEVESYKARNFLPSLKANRIGNYCRQRGKQREPPHQFRPRSRRGLPSAGTELSGHVSVLLHLSGHQQSKLLRFVD